jgi:hypothetical protein
LKPSLSTFVSIRALYTTSYSRSSIRVETVVLEAPAFPVPLVLPVPPVPLVPKVLPVLRVPRVIPLRLPPRWMLQLPQKRSPRRRPPTPLRRRLSRVFK